MRVLFLTQTSAQGASARYRVYQYQEYFESEGIRCDIVPAIPDSIFGALNVPKIYFYGTQIMRRLKDVGRLRYYDIIFLQRDIIVHTYPFIEKIISLINSKIIFDFDDSLYLFPSGKKPNFLLKLFWDKNKIERIIKLSKQVIVGNNFLKFYAEKYSTNVTVVPTSVDLRKYQVFGGTKTNLDNKINIGWIGSQGTFNYIKNIFPVFKELFNKYPIQITVIGAKGYQDKFPIVYKDWELKSEVEDIMNFDIGVMPLEDDEWSQGKSATKLLQYMATGIPSVASPVGVNAEVIKDGENGFLAKNKIDWIRKISTLIEDRQLRTDMAKKARATVEAHYSIQVNAPKLIAVIKKVARAS